MWQPKQIMMNGELMPLEDARLHPLSLAVTYAATVFEGVRAYHLPDSGQFALFRLDDHLRRLQVGMKLMRFDGSYDADYLSECLTRLIRANKPDSDVYIRLLVYIEGTGLLATTGPGRLHRCRNAQGDTGVCRHGHEPGREFLAALIGQRQPAAHQDHGQLRERPAGSPSSQSGRL